MFPIEQSPVEADITAHIQKRTTHPPSLWSSAPAQPHSNSQPYTFWSQRPLVNVTLWSTSALFCLRLTGWRSEEETSPSHQRSSSPDLRGHFEASALETKQKKKVGWQPGGSPRASVSECAGSGGNRAGQALVRLCGVSAGERLQPVTEETPLKSR